MSEDLITWLLEQIAEDERLAHDGEAACAHLDLCDSGGGDYYNAFGFDEGPARLLAECHARRQLVELHVAYRPYAPAEPGGCLPAICLFCTGDREDDVAMPCLHLRLVALPYADRSGFRGEWGL